MALIFYPEAATITGATVGSVAHAVSRGDLTRAGRKGRNLCLIKEQVELFRGRRISKDGLNTSDRAKWERYAQEASQDQKQIPDSALVDEIVARQIAPLQEAVSGMASSIERSRALRQQADEVENEGFRKAFSILRARAAIA